jgi:hypothetical protein
MFRFLRRIQTMIKICHTMKKQKPRNGGICLLAYAKTDGLRRT